MTDRELRKLKRAELLEMMIAQNKEIELLREKLMRAEEKLKEREIRIGKAGSIAEAALQLNHIFEDAQRAADQYLENVYRINGYPEVNENQDTVERTNGKY